MICSVLGKSFYIEGVAPINFHRYQTQQRHNILIYSQFSLMNVYHYKKYVMSDAGLHLKKVTHLNASS